jgi:CelD/BcsL family acetyltransferase involved in cellulose biosynthesis
MTPQPDLAAIPAWQPVSTRHRVEPISSDEQWAASSGSLGLLCTQARAPLFAQPHWLDAAWQWRQPCTTRWFQLVADGDRRCGFAPLAMTPERLLGLPSRTLHFVTVPDTQFADVVVPGEHAIGVAAALAAHLTEQSGRWDRLRLDYLCDRHANWRPFADALREAGITTIVEPAGVNPFIDLEAGFDAYYATRSRKLKKAVNLSANRLARAGNVTVDWVRGGDVEAALAEAIRVSQASWKQSTGNSLDNPGPRAFIERLTRNSVPRGQLSLWLLRVDAKVVATEYQLVDDGNVYALRADFDPGFADASPGTFLNHRILVRLCEAGMRRYFMGPGANAYKLRWTESGEPMYRLTAFSPSLRGRVLQWAQRSALPFARRWRDRLRAGGGQASEPKP